MKRQIIFASLIIIGLTSRAQSPGYPDALYTKAERTRYQETSLNQDVMNFVQMLSAGSSLVSYEIMGTSKKGLEMPLVIMANPGISTPEQAKASGKPVIYIQANIHGGEVEGKEASMIMMREIAMGQKKYLLENQILLFCPVYNADGNEALGPNNRPSQDGSPIEAGERYSGEGLDLNRDGMKLESIEGKALMENVMLRWDPLMFVDLHTTNGTWHGYSLTYAPGMSTTGHPGTTRYLMENLFPEVTEKVRERSGIDTYLYGNFSEFPPKTYNGMLTLPRYLTNSLALRNMLTILVETFAHDRFERRILSNTAWLTSLLEYTSDNATEIKTMIEGFKDDVVQEISGSAGQAMKGVQFDRAPLGPASDLLVYDTQANVDQFGIQRNRRTGRRYWVSGVSKMLSSEIIKEATVPLAYVFPPELTNVAEKLRQHGIPVQTLDGNTSFSGEEFMITSFSQAGTNYQGHNLTTIRGNFTAKQKSFPAGSFYVDLEHPLAYLTFYLLEPEADDGLCLWNYFDDYLIDAGVRTQDVPYPVFKVLSGGLSSGIISLDKAVSIFTNTESGYTEVSLQGNYQEIAEVQLLDPSGKLISSGKIYPGQTGMQISTKHESPGIYLVRIKAGGIQIHKKIVMF